MASDSFPTHHTRHLSVCNNSRACMETLSTMMQTAQKRPRRPGTHCNQKSLCLFAWSMRSQGGPKLLMQRSKLNHCPLLNFYYYTATLSLSTFPTSSTFLSFKTLCCNSTWYYFNAFAFFSYFCLLLDCQQDSWGCRLLYHGFKSNSIIIPRRPQMASESFPTHHTTQLSVCNNSRACMETSSTMMQTAQKRSLSQLQEVLHESLPSQAGISSGQLDLSPMLICMQ